jgi:hypothetical protein
MGEFMEEQSKTNLLFNQTKKIRSFSVDKAHLRKFLEILQERSLAAGEIEITHFKQSDNQSEKQFENEKKELLNGFELFITLSGTDGRKLTGSINDVFNSPNYPDEVSQLYLNTSTSLKTSYNYCPRNEFTLFLDFQKPSVINFAIFPSLETNNESNISVSGKDNIWVNAVFHEVIQFVSQRPSAVPWLHRHSIYDILLIFIGFPFSFWLCSKFSILVSTHFASISEFVRAALYFYIFLVGLNVQRFLFQYARWIWPLIEYKCAESKVSRHRLFWGAIIVGLFSSVFYDLVKMI